MFKGFKMIAALAANAANIRIAALEAKIEWLFDNFEGCDWCDECGGGDRLLAAYEAEIAALEASLGR